MTILEWRHHATTALREQGITSAEIDAELILATVLAKDRTFLASHGEQTLAADETHHANNLLQRRLRFEPIAFLLGHKEFYGVTFKTDDRALIPRGESECLVEEAMKWLKTKTSSLTEKAQPVSDQGSRSSIRHQTTFDPVEDDIVIAEVGTGSGAIILTIANQFPQFIYYATEISQEALELAQENARRLGISICHFEHSEKSRESSPDGISRHFAPRDDGKAIAFLQGDLAEPLLHHNIKANLILVNLPYIPSGLLRTLDPSITYFEPNIALDGGEDGLAIYRDFFPQAQKLLAPHGLLLCEHEYDQGEAMRQLAKRYFPDAKISTLKDYLGHDRLLHLQQ